MKKINQGIITVTTVAAIAIGFLISLQFQTQKEVNTAERIQMERLAQMKTVMATLQDKNNQLKEEQARIAGEIERYKNPGTNNPILIAKLEELKISDGTIPVQGPGIRVVIKDSGPDIHALFPLNTDDLRSIINTLRFARAEAISINGQRVVASSSIVLSGNSTILLNQVPISRIGGTPYEILAIGAQDTLVDYMTKLEAVDLKRYGMQVDIIREIVTIPAFKGRYTYNYAQKIEEKTDE